jgi:zinc protease
MNNRLHIIVGALLAIAAGWTVSAAEPTWDYRDNTLKNGLRVISLEDHSAPIVAVQVWYHVGSKDENPERQGFAHMFEHMMFRGTERIGPEDHFKYLRRYGGEVNGYTTFDTTVYIEEIPSNQLDLAMWLEAERLANLKINTDYFEAEREVVKEEYRMRVADPPYGRVLENVLDLAFKKHPYRWSTIGNLDHLNAATTDELKAFFNTYYVPNNATLVVVGDISHDNVLAKARQYFEWIPRQPSPPRITEAEPPMTEPRRLEYIERVGPLAVIAIGYHTCREGHPDAAVLKVLQAIIASGESSRLYKRLTKERELFLAALGGALFLEQDGIFGFGGPVNVGRNVSEAEAGLAAEIQDLVTNGVTAEEVEKARNNLVAQSVQQRATVAGKAQRLGHAAVILGDVDQVNTELASLMKVTPGDIQRVAQTYFQPQRQMTMVVTPAIATLNPFRGLFKKKDRNTEKATPPAGE